MSKRKHGIGGAKSSRLEVCGGFLPIAAEIRPVLNASSAKTGLLPDLNSIVANYAQPPPLMWSDLRQECDGTPTGKISEDGRLMEFGPGPVTVETGPLLCSRPIRLQVDFTIGLRYSWGSGNPPFATQISLHFKLGGRSQEVLVGQLADRNVLWKSTPAPDGQASYCGWLGPRSTIVEIRIDPLKCSASMYIGSRCFYEFVDPLLAFHSILIVFWPQPTDHWPDMLAALNKTVTARALLTQD